MAWAQRGSAAIDGPRNHLRLPGSGGNHRGGCVVEPHVNVRTKSTAAVLLAAVLLAGCGAGAEEIAVGGGGDGIEGPGTVPGGADQPDDGVGAEDLVVRIEHGVGGFTTADTAFAQLPTFLLTGDGRVISGGPQITIYPGPLLPALQQAQLTEEQVAEIVALAEEHGLDEDLDDQTLAGVITDVGSTIVRVRVGGTVFTSDVYALGMDQGVLSPELARQHEQIRTFIDEVTARYTNPDGVPTDRYEPAAYVIGLQDADLAWYSGSDVQPTVLPWPAELGDEQTECQVVDGDTVRRVLGSANQLTLFERADGSLVKPLLRPALPGSDGCTA